MNNKNWAELEKRYGKSDKTVIERFGKNFFNGIKGWQFIEEELMDANKNGRPITMDLDVPGNVCRLNCVYCFAKVGEHTGTYYRPDKGDKPLTLKEVKKHIIEAKKLGLKSIKIIGYREPFENPEIFDFIEFASNNEIHLVIFKACYTLGEKQFGGEIKKAINFLAQRNVSLMIKLHTLHRETEDEIVRWRGFSEKRDSIFRALLDDGRFTDRTPTRLGIENVISSQDIEELFAIYEYFKMYRNVFVDLDPPIPVGRTATLEQAEKAGLMSQKKLKELCIRTYQINQKHGIPINGISPYFGGDPCSQLPNGVYLTLSGKVYTCCGGDEEIGDVRKTNLKDIFENNPHRKSVSGIYHNCPYREKTGIVTEEFLAHAKKSLGK